MFNNPRPFWSFFKSKPKSSFFPDTMFTDHKPVFFTDQGQAEAFSSFFCSIFTDHSCTLFFIFKSRYVQLLLRICSYPLHYIILSSPEEVLQEFKRLKTSKSTGSDGLPPRILVECAAKIHLSAVNFSIWYWLWGSLSPNGKTLIYLLYSRKGANLKL